MPKIELRINKKQIKIFIDDILHLSIIREEFVALQSWIMGYDEYRKYHIEFTTKTNTIECEYDSIEKWKTILELFDKNELI